MGAAGFRTNVLSLRDVPGVSAAIVGSPGIEQLASAGFAAAPSVRRAPGTVYLDLGGGGGFWCMMRIYPTRGVGVLSMGNATSYGHGAVAEAGRDLGASE